jgi:hypothetical protein
LLWIGDYLPYETMISEIIARIYAKVGNKELNNNMLAYEHPCNPSSQVAFKDLGSISIKSS